MVWNPEFGLLDVRQPGQAASSGLAGFNVDTSPLPLPRIALYTRHTLYLYPPCMRAHHELPILPSCESGRGQFLSALWHETAQSVPAVPECLAARSQVLHALWPRPGGGVLPLSSPASASTQPVAQQEREADQAPSWAAPLTGASVHEAERRQLTVLFCDLVGSTALAGQLDPEDWREVVRAYQTACAEVIWRFEGHIAQYLGDGLLVYFGYPQAHEDDALRAVRAGLGMVEAMDTLRLRLVQEWGIRLAVRLGIHTGLVVVGSMGGGDRQEQLALGEVPNIAARLQGLAAPDTVVLSAATYRLVQGFVACDDLGVQTLRGTVAPMRLYRVLGESGAQSRLDAAVRRGLTPLVGREAEITLLLERWAQAQNGQGQVVMLSGEAGVGKSRLVQELAGARGARGGHAPGLPLFAGSPAERSVPGHRAPATAVAVAPGRHPRGEARQAGARAAGVWLASARDDAVICCPAVAPSARTLPAPAPESRTAKATNASHPDCLAGGGGRATARARCVGGNCTGPILQRWSSSGSS